MTKPSLILKNHGSRNLINQWNNRNSQFFLDQSQSIHQKSSLSPPLSSTTQLFLSQRMNKQDDHNVIPDSPTVNSFELNKPRENSIREESEKSSRNRKKRTIDDDDEYEIPPNTYNVCIIKTFKTIFKMILITC